MAPGDEADPGGRGTITDWPPALPGEGGEGRSQQKMMSKGEVEGEMKTFSSGRKGSWSFRLTRAGEGGRNGWKGAGARGGEGKLQGEEVIRQTAPSSICLSISITVCLVY